ncbi:DUF6069 family protein [Cellulomonas rhizosphaerae]|uniref:Uncharacterized protein n=1 Tax=Cellulomonas rhizosphaerae TaxID=2293719 RepID=A0A413RJ07_9CELL|nr:DUF6069 family protein [Cellulomonas rhizosphaerae]RHA38439.1 hypothetical protein D1825_14295 [Cellulomonas rhizosphaerae]
MRPVPVWSVVLAAPLGALAVWAVAVPVLGVELAVPGSTVGPAAVVVLAALVVLAAWPVRTLFARRADRVGLDPCAAPVGWRVTCGVILAVSLLGPLGASSAGAAITLSVMHGVVGAIVVGGLDPRHARRASTLSRTPVREKAPTR